MTGEERLFAEGSTNTSDFELLLYCARTGRDPVDSARIHTLLRKGIGWEHVLLLAERHGIAPLLYWNLNATCPDAVPENIMAQLRDRFHANSRRNLVLTGELLKILDALEERKVAAIPYKGPVLATVAYGNLALREFGDLDLLVRKDDAIKAKEVLASLGYGPQYHMTKSQEAAFLNYDRQYTLIRDDGCVVELHWTVTPRPVYFLLGPEYLWERAERASLGSGAVASFLSEDLLLVLSVHGSTHLWERISWICDIAELVRVAGDVDWELLVKRASALNCKRMLLLGLTLANDLLDAVLPEEVLREAQTDAEVKALAAEVHKSLFTEDLDARELIEESARWRFHFRMIEQLRDKLRYCIHRATTPTLSDWELVRLPTVLFRFYPLLRPMRLGGKFGRSLAERLRGSLSRSPG
jgi:Uncharacterised nucleotidyltransferase